MVPYVILVCTKYATNCISVALVVNEASPSLKCSFPTLLRCSTQSLLGFLCDFTYSSCGISKPVSWVDRDSSFIFLN